MSNKHLGTYLNDHLAGARAAMELLTELGTMAGCQDWAMQVQSEIAADRQELVKLMSDADIAPSSTRQAVAWMTEKLAELKTRVDDRAGGPLQRLELIEALALGIEGKRALWTVLQAVAADEPVLRGPDYPRLIERADEQRRAVEVRRILAATEALRSP